MPLTVPSIEMGNDDAVLRIVDLTSCVVEPGMMRILEPTPVEGHREWVAGVGGVGFLACIFGGGCTESFHGETIRGIVDPLLLEIRFREFDGRTSRHTESAESKLMAQ